MSTGINVVITKTARRKLVRARAGDMTLPAIVGMAFGDGGVDGNDDVIPPSEDQTALNHELIRKAASAHTYPEQTTCRYECTLTESELAGKYISEIGLYDRAGDIVGIKNFTKKGKDGDMEHTYWVDDIF